MHVDLISDTGQSEREEHLSLSVSVPGAKLCTVQTYIIHIFPYGLHIVIEDTINKIRWIMHLICPLMRQRRSLSFIH